MNFFSEKMVFRLLVATFVFGTLYRLYPVFAGQPVLAQFFVTEDGYLMLTIARNMAIGLGMSVSDGTIPSNGVQPLVTFLFTLPYLMTGGDKVISLAGVHILSAAIAVGGIFSVRALARLMLEPQDGGGLWPWFVAALWYVGPLLLLHTMNGLETGLYTVMVTLTLVAFCRLLTKAEAATLWDRLSFGVLCGITFLVRNDAVFLELAIFVVWALHDLFARRRAFLNVVADLVPPGLLSLVLAAPWLIFNYMNFGSIVPISGSAEALSGGFAKNAGLVPAKLFESVFPMLPVPDGLEREPLFMAAALAVTALILSTFFIGVWRRGGAIRYVITAYVIFAAALCGYYGFSFGAGWFLSRYLSPIAPLFITATVWVAIGLVRRVAPGQLATLLSAVGLAGIVLSIVLLGRYLVPGVREQGHFQVVDWVTQNVPQESWVGAVQTGTVGYWHDRTINLDGKVNPDALNALLTEGDVLSYVVTTPIEYLADWSGLAGWEARGNPAFSDAFEVIVQDPARNLDVLRRQ